jgi:hypothetical protein
MGRSIVAVVALALLLGGACAPAPAPPAAGAGDGQVVHLRGHPIAGLYATGNTAACVDYGAGYQAGLSLARGLTFSYLAVAHLLGAASD